MATASKREIKDTVIEQSWMRPIHCCECSRVGSYLTTVVAFGVIMVFMYMIYCFRESDKKK